MIEVVVFDIILLVMNSLFSVVFAIPAIYIICTLRDVIDKFCIVIINLYLFGFFSKSTPEIQKLEVLYSS